MTERAPDPEVKAFFRRMMPSHPLLQGDRLDMLRPISREQIVANELRVAAIVALGLLSGCMSPNDPDAQTHCLVPSMCLDIPANRGNGPGFWGTVAAMSAATSYAPAGGIGAQPYQGQIDGEFNGWEGETIYRLMDGRVIQQSQYHYYYHYAYSPRVIIYNDGGYKIHVVGDNEDVGIRFLR
jgi:hypothetical protein